MQRERLASQATHSSLFESGFKSGMKLFGDGIDAALAWSLVASLSLLAGWHEADAVSVEAGSHAFGALLDDGDDFTSVYDTQQLVFSGDVSTEAPSDLHQAAAAAAAAAATATAVTWDRDSVIIGGQRVFLFSAEFHPWRLPVPQLWRDALYKLKEGGFNTISIYTHWGLIAPSPKELDLTGINDLGLFLDIAKEVGLFVNVRLGPYINAETTAGGLPGWVQNLEAALRTDDDAYTKAWKPYIQAMGQAIAPRQLNLGQDGSIDPRSGPVILVQLENEYIENTKTRAYVQGVKDTLVAAGISHTAFSYNEASAENPEPSFKSIVDLWGVDAYPQGFDCKNPSQWKPASIKYRPAQEQLNVTTPYAIWEFQAGAFDPYDGAGYDKCLQLTNARFARVFGLNNLAQDFKILSHYMAYGGTNWGNLAEPTVYSSYDYGAPLSEDLQIRDKLREYGLLGGFLRSSPRYPGSRPIGSGVNLGVSKQTADIRVYQRREESKVSGEQAHWYIVRQNDSTSNEPADFKLTVTAGKRNVTIPEQGSLHLDGRDAKIISTNHALPSGATLLYSTAGLSFAGQIGGRDVVVLHGDAGQSFEAVLQTNDTGSVRTVAWPSTGANFDTSKSGSVRVNWQTASKAATYAEVKWEDGSILLVLADTLNAYTTRPLTLSAQGALGHYLQDQEVVLISGGYHIANATLSSEGLLKLYGQSNETSSLEILSPNAVRNVAFNGKDLGKIKQSEYGSYRVHLSGIDAAAARFEPPALDDWRYADSLPEIGTDFDDSDWVRANLTSTPNAYFSVHGISTEGHVLFSDAYGFHGGNIVWRGHFEATGKETGLEIRIQGGSFFGGSVWLNRQHLGSVTGSAKNADGNISATFDHGVLRIGEDNVLTVLHDSTGLEEWVGPKALGAGNDDNSQTPQPAGAQYPLEGPKIPRGILSFQLRGDGAAAIKDWRVQGNYRGEQCPDTVRKCLNEGGLHGEVAGWHLPGYDTSKWTAAASEEHALTIPSAGVRFFSTTVKTVAPLQHYLPISVVFPSEKQTNYRALLYVNGWQFGKRLAQFGPQRVFPIPPGVLDPRGENKIDVALWSLNGTQTITGGLELKVQGRLAGDVEYDVDNPTWQDLRS